MDSLELGAIETPANEKVERRRAGPTVPLRPCPDSWTSILFLACSFVLGRRGAGVEREEDKEPCEAGMASFYTSTRRLRR